MADVVDFLIRFVIVILPSLLVILLVWLIAGIAGRFNERWYLFLCSRSGWMSLSKSQVALWTIAVGFVLTVFAFMRLAVGEIPDSVVVLMGMSVTTGGISYHYAMRRRVKDQEKAEAEIAAAKKEIESATGKRQKAVEEKQRATDEAEKKRVNRPGFFFLLTPTTR